MTIRGLVFKGMGLSVLLGLAACSAATDDPTLPEPTDDTDQGVHGEQICPEILILCAEGYHVKYGPNCHQVCVPDKPSKSDCTPGCGAGEYCALCKTVNGAGYVCLPDGAVC